MNKGIVLCILGGLFLSIFFLSIPTVAQSGRWVEYDPNQLGSGIPLYDRGEACIGYCRAGSRYFLLFDATIGDWNRIDIGAPQTFSFVQSEGNVVFAYSNDILFAYSSSLHTWDTVTFSGNVLHVASTSPQRSYGCSDSLAFFATDEKLYVFDGSVGEWIDYDLTFPGGYSTGRFYPCDDYIALVLSKSDVSAAPKNVVYSAHTRSFNELENGCYLSALVLDHGFSSVYGYSNDYLLVGYSAFTNEFSTVSLHISDPASESIISGFWPLSNTAEEYTTYEVGFRTVVIPFVSVTCTFYGYNTYSGAWNNMTVNFNWGEMTYYGNSQVGGQFAVDFANAKSNDLFTYYFYSGLDGAFHTETPGIGYKSTTYRFICGGTAFTSADSLLAWGYSLQSNQGNLQDLSGAITNGIWAGEDWTTLARYTRDDTVHMDVYFYNGRLNSWSSIATSYRTSYYPNVSQHLCVDYDWTHGQLLFYSSIRDEIINYKLPDRTSVATKIQGDLAYALAGTQSFLYNGKTGQMTNFTFSLSQNGLGLYSGAFADKATNTLYGYNAASGSITTLTVDAEPYIVVDTGYIGLVSTSLSQNKFYAFNSFSDNWVELVPEGTHQLALVGEKTALVVRYNPARLYAFDPQGIPTDVADGNGVSTVPNMYSLNQNYPNPFNPSTTIEFSLPSRSQVDIAVYNVMGQKVKQLLHSQYPAGKHSVIWDGKDAEGKTVASGIYFYRMQTDEFSETRKMILMK